MATPLIIPQCSTINESTDPKCPFCKSKMRFIDSSQYSYSMDEVKQSLICDECDIIVYIHSFV